MLVLLVLFRHQQQRLIRILPLLMLFRRSRRLLFWRPHLNLKHDRDADVDVDADEEEENVLVKNARGQRKPKMRRIHSPNWYLLKTQTVNQIQMRRSYLGRMVGIMERGLFDNDLSQHGSDAGAIDLTNDFLTADEQVRGCERSRRQIHHIGPTKDLGEGQTTRVHPIFAQLGKRNVGN